MEGRDGEGRRVNKMKKRGQRYLGSSEIIGREGPDMLSQEPVTAHSRSDI